MVRGTKLWFAALLLPAALAGCAAGDQCALDRCATIPPGAMPLPTGAYTRNLQDAQAVQAEADDFVIYHHEWYLGGIELGPYGKYHLQQIAQRLPGVPFPVIVQASADPKLNETRRVEVIKNLMAAGLVDVEPRVVVGFPLAGGLYGDEGERIFNQMQQGVGNPYGFFGGAFGGGYGGGFGGYGSNFFGGGRSMFRGGLGLGNFPFF
jgi:hypothetical protein